MRGHDGRRRRNQLASQCRILLRQPDDAALLPDERSHERCADDDSQAELFGRYHPPNGKSDTVSSSTIRGCIRLAQTNRWFPPTRPRAEEIEEVAQARPSMEIYPNVTTC